MDSMKNDLPPEQDWEKGHERASAKIIELTQEIISLNAALAQSQHLNDQMFKVIEGQAARLDELERKENPGELAGPLNVV